MWAHPSLDWIASVEATDSNEEGRAREVADAYTHKQTNAYERVHVAHPIPDSALSNAPTVQWLGLPDLLRIATMLLASNHCATRRFTKAITFYHQMG